MNHGSIPSPAQVLSGLDAANLGVWNMGTTRWVSSVLSHGVGDSFQGVCAGRRRSQALGQWVTFWVN
jgi:hypothetical protein